MKVEFIDDAHKVLRKAWSVRFNIAASLCGVAEVVLPMFSDLIPRGSLAVLMVMFSLFGLYARFVKQPEMHDGK
ncbi:MAG: hypothetical protein V4669_13555 [Pseudomonadota bacterium]